MSRCCAFETGKQEVLHRPSLREMLMDTAFCIEAVEEALSKHGKPEIFNSDQGKRLWRTIKYEEVYLRAYASVPEARASLGRGLLQDAVINPVGSITKAGIHLTAARNLFKKTEPPLSVTGCRMPRRSGCSAGDRKPPGQHLAAEPVDHGREIDEAPRHGDEGDVDRPDLVRPRDRQPAQQIRVDLVARSPLRGVRAPIDRRDPHALHQCRNVKPADIEAFANEEVAHHPATRERVIQMQFVDPVHQRQISGGNRSRQIIDAPPADAEGCSLLPDGQRVLTVYHRFSLSNPALVSAPAKKSFVSVNSPISACSSFTSMGGGPSALPSPPKTPAAPSRSCVRQDAI